MIGFLGLGIEPLAMLYRELQSLLPAYIAHRMRANHADDLLVLTSIWPVDVDRLPFFFSGLLSQLQGFLH